MIDSGNTAWLLTATALVLFMTLPGLALFYGGLVRAENLLSVLMQCFAIACLVSVLWLLGAYSLTFSGAGPWLGNLDKALLLGVTRDAADPNTKIPETVFFMFQMTFAIITPALIVGAFAERMRFGAVLLFTVLWLFLVYVPVAHWVWGGGWLAARGVLDYAGGLVVHLTAGISALVLAIVIGPRAGFPNDVKPPHAPWMTMAGACMLWVGWFGFNAGSALKAGGDAGMAMTVTHISAATAALVWLVIESVKFGKPSMIGIVTGAVAGLATITPASGFVGPAGALIIGLRRRHDLLRHGRSGQTAPQHRRFARCVRRAWRGRRHRRAAHRDLRRCRAWRHWPCRGAEHRGSARHTGHRAHRRPHMVAGAERRHRQGNPGLCRLARQRRDRRARPRPSPPRRTRLQHVITPVA